MTPQEIADSIAAIGFAKTHEIMAKLAKQTERPASDVAPPLDWQAVIARNRRAPKVTEAGQAASAEDEGGLFE